MWMRGVSVASRARLAPEPGVRRGIDGNGDLLINSAGAQERAAFLPALDAARWYDPETREPVL
jgi:hypothetical protein